MAGNARCVPLCPGTITFSRPCSRNGRWPSDPLRYWLAADRSAITKMQGKRIVAMGLGRSGLAVARAALVHGALPIVVDEKVDLLKPELVDEARAEGIDVRLGWNGSFGELHPDLVVVNPAVDSRHPKLQEEG